MSSYTHPSIPSDYDVEHFFSLQMLLTIPRLQPNIQDFFPPEDISPPKDTETPVESPIPVSPSSSVGSSSPVRSTTPPPDYPFDESIFAELDNSLWIIPRPLGSEPVPEEPDESDTCYNMPPKRTSTSETPTMTQAAIRQLIVDGIAAALEALVLRPHNLRFQELAVLCPNMVPNTEKLMEVFIRGLPRSIKGNVTASKSQTLEEAITITQRLMEQIVVLIPHRSTSDIKDAFSSMNILNYTSVSSDYFPSSPGSSSFNSVTTVNFRNKFK
ncbi:hypothetical protein Tco_0563373 [Tanacetum coccineum]